MPRSGRKKSETGIYHVMLRGINRQPIFAENEDYYKYLSLLTTVKDISGFKLYAYCLMENHIHLLLKEDGEPLGQIFKRLGSRYVFWFNKKYNRVGHLFQDRFKSAPVEDEGYFIRALFYIYQNPVEAGICAKPRDYEWSSRKNLGKNCLIDEDELFGIIPIDAIKLRDQDEIIGELQKTKAWEDIALLGK